MLMDLHSLLSASLTLKKLNIIADTIISDKEKFNELFEMIFDTNVKIAWHAAWAVEKISEKDCSFFSEEQIERLILLSIQATNNSLKRSVLSVIINLPLPENLSVEFINVCFERMISMKEPVAVQALSMRLLQRIAEKEPEFIPEILVTLENVDLTAVSAGYLAIRKNVMKVLNARLKS